MSNHRNRKLLDALRELPCTADFPHDCRGQIVACHANDAIFGRGFAYKTPDHFTAAMCKDAHDIIDGRKGGWSKDDKRYAWLRAYVRTQNLLWDGGLIEVAR